MASVVINAQDMISVRSVLSEIRGGSKAAIRFATNDTLSGLQTESIRLIREKVTLTATIVRRYFTINRMSVSDETAHITCTGEPVPLINYSARSVLRGVSVQVFRNLPRTVVRHAFIATMRSGHRGVFWREDREGGTGKWPVGRRMTLPSPQRGSRLREYQLSITERYGPRVPDIFDDDNIINPVLEHASIRFQDRLEYHTQRLLDRAAAA